jgi:hypothetical protein
MSCMVGGGISVHDPEVATLCLLMDSGARKQQSLPTIRLDMLSVNLCLFIGCVEKIFYPYVCLILLTSNMDYHIDYHNTEPCLPNPVLFQPRRPPQSL